MSHAITATVPAGHSHEAATNLETRRKNKVPLIAIASLLLVLMAMVLATRWPHYAASSVCEECGIRRDFYDWSLRFDDFVVHRFATENTTAVSRVLAEAGAVPPHQHRWSAPAAPPASFEEGAEVAPNLLFSVEAPRVGCFLAELAHSPEAGALPRWRAVVLDAKFSVALEPALRFLRYPVGGFANQTAFRNWWRQNQPRLVDRLREMTEPD